MKYKTCRAVGRPRKRWEDEINDFLRSDRIDSATNTIERNNNGWIKTASSHAEQQQHLDSTPEGKWCMILNFVKDCQRVAAVKNYVRDCLQKRRSRTPWRTDPEIWRRVSRKGLSQDSMKVGLLNTRADHTFPSFC